MAYQPPAASTSILGVVTDMLKSATPINGFKGANFVATLPGGVVFFDSKLWIDTDGSAFAAQDNTGQPDATSLRKADGSAIDANTVRYIALPPELYTNTNIDLGDFAVVIRGARMTTAIFADSGPSFRIGEASIAVHRALGNDPVDKNGTFTDSGLEATENILTIVFPGSGNGFVRTDAEIDAAARLLLVGMKAAWVTNAVLSPTVQGLRKAIWI